MMLGLATVIAALTISMMWYMVQSIADPDLVIVDKQSTLQFLGYFLLIIICIELMDTLITYAKRQVVKVETVILVAITAAARELIVQDYEKVDPLLLIGIGAILVASAATYFMVRKARIDSHLAGLDHETDL
jgi:uncharacterized membrane protein (DUF373 family)